MHDPEKPKLLVSFYVRALTGHIAHALYPVLLLGERVRIFYVSVLRSSLRSSVLHFNVGILNNQGIETALKQWSPLVEYMNNNSVTYFGTQHVFHLVPVTFEGTAEAVSVSILGCGSELTEWYTGFSCDQPGYLCRHAN